MASDITTAREVSARDVWSVFNSLIRMHMTGDREGLEHLHAEVGNFLHFCSQLSDREREQWEIDAEQAWRCLDRHMQDVDTPEFVAEWMELAAELVAAYPDLAFYKDEVI